MESLRTPTRRWATCLVAVASVLLTTAGPNGSDAGAAAAGPPQIAAAATVPPDGTFVRLVSTGRIYRIAGRAPVFVSNWGAFGGRQPTRDVAWSTFSRWPLRPAEGTFLLGLPGRQVYRVAGGAPVYVSTWMPFGGPRSAVGVDQNAIDHAGESAGEPWNHLSAVPANGTFIRGLQSRRVFRIAWGAPIAVSNWAVFGGPQRTVDVDQAAIDRSGEATARRWQHLLARPMDKHFLRGRQTGRIYLVHGQSLVHIPSWAPWGAPQPAVDVDQVAIDRAGGPPPWDHLTNSPVPSLRLPAKQVLDTAVGEHTTLELALTGGVVPPVRTKLVAGRLPSGLTLDGARLSGVPTAPSRSVLTLEARDARSRPVRMKLTFTVYPTPTGGTGPLPAGWARRVDLTPAGDPTSASNRATAVSDGGRFIVMVSDQASQLLPGRDTRSSTVVLADVQTGRMELIDVASDGTAANAAAFQAALSGDGNLVVFNSQAANLVPGDGNGRADVFVRDRRRGTTELVSATAEGGVGDEASYSPAISADGRYVAFTSAASDLVPGDGNGAVDVFVRDRRSGVTRLVSAGPRGASGNGLSSDPALSADGRHVAFLTLAGDLVPGMSGIVSPQVMLRDLDTGVTRLVSTFEGGPARGIGHSASVSADGSVVAYVDGAMGTIYVRDMRSGIVQVANKTRYGTTQSAPSRPLLSDDGRLVVFTAESGYIDGLKVGLDASCWWDLQSIEQCAQPPGGEVYVHDRVTGRTRIVNLNTDRLTPSGIAVADRDGAVVAYTWRDSATGPSHVYVRRLHGSCPGSVEPRRPGRPAWLCAAVVP